MPIRASLASLTVAAACLAPAVVRADTLYKCEGPGGTIAYTNKKESFTACKAVASYAARKPAPSSAQATRRWDYQERVDPKAQRSGVVSTAPLVASTTPPADAAKPEAVAQLDGKAGPAPVKAVVASAAPATPKVVRGAVYRVDRKDGIVEYTNVPPRGGKYALLFSYIATCVACDVHSKIDFSATRLNLDAYRDEVAQAAAEFGVDAALIRAVMHAESAFNPMALSSKGAQGLMQLMPGTASDLGVVDAFDAAENIRGGAQYLSQMLRNFNGDVRLATAAYNSGPGAVQKYGNNVPPFAETQVYVERVATLRERYSKAL
ncbi:lytic transglycosylase domain-containing protein [Dokdonella sp. MW10]|uniref:lytic transglycosylase domain-containing protein n=1 Tax=Dokdonella sp. MW10 TaxID=2992926 RepID=UPI003F7F0256